MSLFRSMWARAHAWSVSCFKWRAPRRPALSSLMRLMQSGVLGSMMVQVCTPSHGARLALRRELEVPGQPDDLLGALCYICMHVVCPACLVSCGLSKAEPIHGCLLASGVCFVAQPVSSLDNIHSTSVHLCRRPLSRASKGGVSILLGPYMRCQCCNDDVCWALLRWRQ